MFTQELFNPYDWMPCSPEDGPDSKKLTHKWCCCPFTAASCDGLIDHRGGGTMPVTKPCWQLLWPLGVPTTP